jgi:pimeloyl-ACP methyl ester carboxylesterase
MELDLLLAILIFSIITIALLIKLLLFPMTYFGQMDYEQVYTRDVKIPVGEFELNGRLYLPKYVLNDQNLPKEKLPLIFLNHGWSMSLSMTFLTQNAVAIALGGPFACLVYECRGHGKSPGEKKLTQEIFDDIPRVFDFGETLPEIDPDRMGFIGMSFGGEVALTRAYTDPRIKAIVSVSGLHNAKVNFSRKVNSLGEKINQAVLKKIALRSEEIPDEVNISISPEFILKPDRSDLNDRVFLIFSRDDEVIAYSEFEKNQEILQLPKENILLLKNGGHKMAHQELIILSRALQFFHSKLK